VNSVDTPPTVFVVLVVLVAVIVDVTATVCAPAVEVLVTTVVVPPLPAKVVVPVYVDVLVTTTVDVEDPLLPAKYPIAPTTTAATITAPIRAGVPIPFLWNLNEKTAPRRGILEFPILPILPLQVVEITIRQQKIPLSLPKSIPIGLHKI
jgi:hypothetical protein